MQYLSNFEMCRIKSREHCKLIIRVQPITARPYQISISYQYHAILIGLQFVMLLKTTVRASGINIGVCVCVLVCDCCVCCMVMCMLDSWGLCMSWSASNSVCGL